MQNRSTSQPSKPFVVVAESADWEGVYINGVLQAEDFSISPGDIFAMLGIHYDKVKVSEEWLENNGRSLPIELKDLEFFQ